jgi:hypothetical protein
MNLSSNRERARAAWSPNHARETLAIIERFEEDKVEPPGSYGLHDCEPSEVGEE